MRRGIGLAVAIAIAHAGSAVAGTLCVPNTSIPGCPVSAASEPTIQDAANNANSGDTVLIAAGTYNESVNDMTTNVTFVGAGPTKTIIKAQGSPGLAVASSSKVMGLGIEVYTGPGNTGLQLAGTATNVAITPQAGVTYADGVQLVGGGVFSHGTVALPLNPTSLPPGYGGVLGDGRVTDSNIVAPVGVRGDPANLYKTPSVIRDRIRANQGVLVGATATTVDDSLIRTVGGPSTEQGVGLDPNLAFGSFAIRHSTIVGSGTSGSTGVSADASNPAIPATTSALIESTILRGYATSIKATAEQSPPFTASTTVTVRHTFYAPAASQTSATGGGHATINRDSHSGNFNPLFVNPAAGNFQLQAGSPAIDAGIATLASGESTTDLAGAHRRLVGRKGDALISDVGAYEFRPHVPTGHATASRRRPLVGQSVTFHATGSDASPGDVVSFRWNFGGGSSATGPTASHTFTKRGTHTVSVRVTDLDHYTATFSIVVTVRPRRH